MEVIRIAEKKWYWVTATVLAVLLGGSWVYLSPTEGYDICYADGNYGSWYNITETVHVNDDFDAVGKYRCDLEDKELWCGGVSGGKHTRCYYILEEGLIPKDLSQHTRTTDHYCDENGTCNLILYSGIRNVFEDGRWVRVENSTKSLKDYYDVVYIERDESLDLVVKDFGYNWIDVDLKVKDEKHVGQMTPIKIDKGGKEIEVKKFLWNNVGELKTHRIEIDNVLVHNFSFGKNSTTIILQDADTENLEDTYVNSSASNTNYGTADDMYIDNGFDLIGYITFNISSFEYDTIVVEDSILRFYGSYNEQNTWDVWHVYNYTWTETDLTWNNQPCPENCSETYAHWQQPSSDDDNKIDNETIDSFIEDAANNGNNTISFKLETNTGVNSRSYRTKEYIFSSYRPYLNITYSSTQSAPTEPNNITCDGGTCNSTFTSSVDMQCNGSTDSEGDTITYKMYYSNTTEHCSGTPQGCGNYTTEENCNISGCTWNGSGGENSTLFYDGGEDWTHDTNCPGDCPWDTCSVSSAFLQSVDDTGGGYPSSVQNGSYYIIMYDADGGDTCELIQGEDISSCNEAYVKFAQSSGTSNDGDYGYVYVSDNSGSSWTEVYNTGGEEDNSWYNHSIKVSDYVSLNSNFQVKFLATNTWTPDNDEHTSWDDIRIVCDGGSGVCEGSPSSCGTFNDSETNCTLTNCTWNPYEYLEMGNHTEGNNYIWDISGFSEGKVFESFKCSAVDLNGSGDYSDNYTQSSNFTVGVAGVADVNLSFGPPDTDSFMWVGCSPDWENASATPKNQTDTYGIDYVCNNGTVAGDIQVKLSSALNDNWTVYADNESGLTDPLTLSTSYQTIYDDLAQDACGYVWFKANCSYVHIGPGAYEIYQAV